MATGDTDLITVIVSDHRAVQSVFAELQSHNGSPEHRRNLADSHPHRSAPDKPPANKLLGTGAGLVDRMRDALSGRST